MTMERIEIGDATLFCADCRDILPTLGKVDAVVTDPPYGVGFKYDGYEDTEDNFKKHILPIIEYLWENTPFMLLNMSFKRLWDMPRADWMLCWAKPGSTRRSMIGGFSEWEPILVYGKPMKRIYNDYKYLPDCANHFKGDIDHPCPKPIKLFEWLIDIGTIENAAILDPFMGSGTTGVACARLGRKFIGIEIEPKYFEIACERIDREYAQGKLF